MSRTAEEYRNNSFARNRLMEGLGNLASEARNLSRQDAQEIVQRFGQLGQRKFRMAA